jgi:hypothetical protein
MEREVAEAVEELELVWTLGGLALGDLKVRRRGAGGGKEEAAGGDARGGCGGGGIDCVDQGTDGTTATFFDACNEKVTEYILESSNIY